MIQMVCNFTEGAHFTRLYRKFQFISPKITIQHSILILIFCWIDISSITLKKKRVYFYSQILAHSINQQVVAPFIAHLPSLSHAIWIEFVCEIVVVLFSTRYCWNARRSNHYNRACGFNTQPLIIHSNVFGSFDCDFLFVCFVVICFAHCISAEVLKQKKK